MNTASPSPGRVDVNCDLCDSANALPLYALNQASIVRCRECGFCYVNPRLSSEGMHELLQQWAVKDVVDTERLRVAFDQTTLALYRSHLRQVASFRPGKGRLLDIGCATGALLTIAREEGWEVEGLEIGQASATYARDQFGLTVRTGSLFDFKANEAFDAVSFLEVIEHLESPTQAIRRIHDLLKPGGMLLLSTPNYDSLYRRLFGSRWWVVNCEDEHIMLFNAASLRRLLERENFDLVSLQIRSIDMVNMTRELYGSARGQAAEAHGYYQSRTGKQRVKTLLRKTGLLGMVRKSLQGLDWIFSQPWAPCYGWGEQLVAVARRTDRPRELAP